MPAASFFSEAGELARERARRWLLLAVCAVSVSGLFAILIALARVPALGRLFPGAEFYRVALVLHVNLSQGVWFMAFAGVLWSLMAVRESNQLERGAWGLAVAGAIGMVLSISFGETRPLMSNYLPVLDSSVFLASLAVFGLAVLLKAGMVLAGSVACGKSFDGLGQRQLLIISAATTIGVFFLLIAGGTGLERSAGLIYFENLFWGAGHLWQLALAGLLMFCWLELAPQSAGQLSKKLLKTLVLLSLVPIMLALALPFVLEPGSGGYLYGYTWLMQWMSWEAPLILGLCLLLRRGSPVSPGFRLSLVLFVAGLCLGAMIDGQTTLVTAHYHGTIGAITLAFMAVSFLLLPVIGIDPPSLASVRLQLAFYGYGVLMMMAGLAGAGLMGAPRKTPGDLGMTMSVETFSRILLGVGGLCATIGILMFAFLLIGRIFPVDRKNCVCHE